LTKTFAPSKSINQTKMTKAANAKTDEQLALEEKQMIVQHETDY